MEPPSHRPTLDVQTRWARLLIRSLVAAGVRDAVISPGSRSTPFTLAALDCSELTCHSVIDERSAGFFALGLSRASGSPPLLICTSGSAPAHYYPAVIEASAEYLPLIVLSADRPFELQRSGANQTTDQLRLFGEHARAFVDLGAPHASPLALRALVRTARQIVHASLYPEAGPVQINAPARKPLEPQFLKPQPGQSDPADGVDDELLQGWATIVDPVLPRLPESLLADCREAQRPLLVVGAQNPCHDVGDAILAVAEQLGCAVAGDAGSRLRYSSPERCFGLEAVLRSDAGQRALAPDLLLQVGRTPVGSGWQAFLEHQTAPRWVFSQQGFHDPTSNARGFVLGPVANALGELIRHLGETPQTSVAASVDVLPVRASWQRRVERVARVSAEAITQGLQERAGEFSELNVVRTALSFLPPVCNLMLGNSLAIRHADFVGAPPAAEPPTASRRVDVFTQRGTSGIDGNVAGALGAAKKSGRPTLLIIGDVSLAHDIGSLQLASDLAVPLVVLVLDNAGGQIFRQLPIASREPPDFHFFTTPPRLDLSGAATLFGCRHVRCSNPSEVSDALKQAWDAPGLTLVEAKLGQPAVATVVHQLATRVATRLAALGAEPLSLRK